VDRAPAAEKELAHEILYLESLTDYGRWITVNVGVALGVTRPNVVPATACGAAQ
jgi:glutamate carboxypeptidase